MPNEDPDAVNFAMKELFKFRRMGQDPRESMRSVIDHLIRPENPGLAERMGVECVQAPAEGQGEGELFRSFVITFAARLEGHPASADEAQRLAGSVREAYARHQAELERDGGPVALTPELQRVDAVLKEHHLWLHKLGDVEKWAYLIALAVFFGCWLGLKLAWWQAVMIQLGVYALMVVASIQIAGYRVRATAKEIGRICPPRGPHFEAALRRMSKLDPGDVQLIEDVLAKTRSLGEGSR